MRQPVASVQASSACGGTEVIGDGMGTQWVHGKIETACDVNNEVKFCRTCHRGFPPSTEYFYKHHSNRDRLNHHCKSCVLKKCKEYKTRPEVKERRRRESREYRIRNHEEQLAYDREYRKRSDVIERRLQKRLRQQASRTLTSTTPSGFKNCAGCKTQLPTTTEYFYADKSAKDGVDNYCKSCRSAMDKIRRQNTEYKRRESERSARRYQTPERKAYLREYNKRQKKSASQ